MNEIIFIPNHEIRNSIENGEIFINVEVKTSHCLDIIGMPSWEYEYFEKTFKVSSEFLIGQTKVVINDNYELNPEFNDEKFQIKQIKCNPILKYNYLEDLAIFLWESGYVVNLDEIPRGYFGNQIIITISIGTKTKIVALKKY